MQAKKVVIAVECCTPGCGPACGCGPSVIPAEDLLLETQRVRGEARNALRTVRT